MPTLYIENVPADLYAALRGRARERRSSIAKEVLALLEENVPTKKELRARQLFLRQVLQMRSRKLRSRGAFRPTEELQREDRAR